MNYFFLFDEILKKKINFIYTIFSLRFFGFSFSFFNPCLIKKLYMAHLFLKKTYLHIQYRRFKTLFYERSRNFGHLYVLKYILLKKIKF